MATERGSSRTDSAIFSSRIGARLIAVTSNQSQTKQRTLKRRQRSDFEVDETVNSKPLIEREK